MLISPDAGLDPRRPCAPSDSPSVSGAYAEALRTFLLKQGLAWPEPSRPVEAIPAHRVPGSTFVRVLDDARRNLGDPLVGLHFGIRAGAAGYGLMGVAAATATSLRDTIRHLHRFASLTSTLGDLSSTAQSGFVSLIWNPLPGVDTAVVEATLAGWVSFARHLVGASAEEIGVTFAHRPCATRQRYEQLLECRVEFDASTHSVSVPADLLEARPRLADGNLNAAIGNWLHECTAAVRPCPHRPTARRVALLLGTRIPLDTGDMNAAADALHVSTRTLQRRLSAESTSFRQLLDATRAHHAIVRLLRGRTPLMQVGVEVGFSEQSSLCRAFRRWTGCSPLSLRRQLGRVYHDVRR
ncbi:AraC family transcriptional regulator [Aquabacterium humicola]|uniref:AraC family transcriptional regulator n=1 Tax=Aquabacterium humicola TaxID=3237377 RepID=UPI0025432A05|nr:AraC family transcriptional regulator [Rubrivivax pictus]